MNSPRRVIAVWSFVMMVLFSGQGMASMEKVLPDSSYSTDWEGYKYYGLPGTPEHFKDMRGRVDFAVYDMQQEDLSNDEQALISSLDNVPENHQYLYAYQIFNDYTGYSLKPVDYFALLGIEEGTDFETTSGNDSPDDPSEEGTGPTSGEEGVWKFTFDKGLIEAEKHSWFLFVTSANAPILGDFKINGPGDTPVPGDVPEPGSIILLAGATAIAALKRRRRV
ncbi:MAG: PEP-CTERM sorting domain-containing protein [Planctomycetes bacterium]|nr:PEP-CTERM sorting domain-containing protein [Planctomycetota bacterium]